MTRFSYGFKELLQTLDKDGDPATVMMLTAYRDGKELPLRDESDGVRKIISVLSLIIAAFNQKSVTVAIDEFDAGIFEYLLGEILQALEESGRGQFIFTSHNLRPLEVIDKKFLYFTTTNPDNRYIRLKNISATNNLRDTYFREIILCEQEEEIYNKTKRFKNNCCVEEGRRRALMGKRPKRKIVLFLVEGKSDREALQLAIPELYDEIDEDIEVYFPIIRKEEEEKGGDITSTNYENKQGKHYWVHPSNIEEAIYELFLDDFFDKEKILPKDISEIIQIVDTDGAYIPNECVVLDSSLSEEDSPFYKDDKIACLDVDKIVKRNEQKSENLDYLSSCTTIKVKQKTVPYSVYYVSCNLDHYLHRSANLDYRMKRSLADTFARTYIGDVEGFIKEFLMIQEQ